MNCWPRTTDGSWRPATPSTYSAAPTADRPSCRKNITKGFDPAIVKRVEQMLYVAEYKRRQAAPGVKLTTRNFGRDRRYPIVNAFRDAR